MQNVTVSSFIPRGDFGWKTWNGVVSREMDMEKEQLHEGAGSVRSKRPALGPPPEHFSIPSLLAYHQFCQARRLLMPATLRNSAMESLLGQQWKALPEAEKLQYKRAKVATEAASGERADLSPHQTCTLAASGLPNAASSDTLPANDEAELFVTEVMDTALDTLTAEESIEMMLAADSSANPSQPPLGLDHQQHGGSQAEGGQDTFGETVRPQQATEERVAQQETIAESSGPPLSEQLPTGQGTPARGNTSLQELFVRHVMCDYTPRHPKDLPMSAWVSITRLSSQLQQHAPAEVKLLGLNGVKQMITESQMNHPAFKGLPFSAWCKKLKDERPQAHYRAQIIKFPFAYTPPMH